jgi:hypothetical protein
MVAHHLRGQLGKAARLMIVINAVGC